MPLRLLKLSNQIVLANVAFYTQAKLEFSLVNGKHTLRKIKVNSNSD